MVAQADPDQVDDRVLHRHLDMLAAPGLMALLQRRENADRHVHPGAAVADRRQHNGRRVFREAGHRHRAAHRLRHRLVALEMRVGAVAAEALDRRVDQPRVEVAQHVPAEPQPLHRAGAEIFEQHVRLFDDFLEQPLSVVGLQVERQAALVGVEQQEEQAVGAGLFEMHGARDIARFRLFELDHVGAEKGQDLGAGRPRLVVRHVDDADAGKGLGHAVSPDPVLSFGSAAGSGYQSSARIWSIV